MQQAIYDVMASCDESDEANSSESKNSYLLIGGTAIVIVTMLGIQSIVSVFVEHKHFHLLSEAAVSIIIGLLVGLIVFLAADKHYFVVDQSFFFFGLLPIIIFKEGYGLNKQHFFKNFFYVCLYGIAGTIFNFILIAAMTYGMVQLNWYFIEGDVQSLGAVLIYSACITSKDSAVSLQVLNFELTPKLHSILFGEQILNDVVVFSLQKTSLLLEKNLNNGETPQWYYVFIFIGLIILQILVSLIVGLILGTLATWITKKCRFFIHHSSIITAFTIYFGYLAFALCEAFGFCGVISVLVCGIMLSHYQAYNLPKISSQSSKITVKALSYISETFIYIYIGFYALVQPTNTNNNDNSTAVDIPFSYKFFFVQLLVVIPFSRFFSLLLSHGFALLFRLKTKGKWRINRYEFFIIFYSGLIRGVVAFALVSEEKPPDNKRQLDSQIKIAQELTLYIVLFTTLIIGGSLKYVCEAVYKLMDDNNVLRSSSLILPNNPNRKTFILEEKDSYKLFHPKSEKLFKKLDEYYIKPFLIYNYVERKDDIRQAKKEERKKLEYEQEAEEKLYDDSVRHRRLEQQKQQQQQQQQSQESQQSQSSKRQSENPTVRSQSDQPQQMELSVPIQKKIIEQSPDQIQQDLHITESRIIEDQSNDQIVNQSKQ